MSMTGRTIADVDTPALLVDIDRLQANIQRYATLARRAQVRLRPHIKTHKTLEVARMQLQAGAAGISAAKVSEAEVFAAAGITDIFIAYPVIGREKALRVARLAQSCHLIVGVESVTGIQQLSAAATEVGSTILVRIEIDAGLHRTGVVPEAAEELCRQALEAPGLQLDGIFTYRGGSFTRSLEEMGHEEGELMVTLAEQLRGVGIPIKEISIGSTPTMSSAVVVPGVTEVRPGTYVFFDRMTTRVGVSSFDEIALSILATVVSRPSHDMAVVDAGSKTFCGDVFPAHANLDGYAVTLDGESGVVERMNEEHGMVRLAPGFSPQVGDKIAFFPNHVCTTVNLSDELLVVQDGTVKEIWPVAARGRRR